MLCRLLRIVVLRTLQIQALLFGVGGGGGGDGEPPLASLLGDLRGAQTGRCAECKKPLGDYVYFR